MTEVREAVFLREFMIVMAVPRVHKLGPSCGAFPGTPARGCIKRGAARLLLIRDAYIVDVNLSHFTAALALMTELPYA